MDVMLRLDIPLPRNVFRCGREELVLCVAGLAYCGGCRFARVADTVIRIEPGEQFVVWLRSASGDQAKVWLHETYSVTLAEADRLISRLRLQALPIALPLPAQTAVRIRLDCVV